MRRGKFMAGAMIASLAAGPTFLASLALAAWTTSTPTPYVLEGNTEVLGGGLVALFFAVPAGFFFSVFPNLIGTWFMHGISIGNFALRLPVAWALVGAGTAGMTVALLSDLSSDAGLLIMAFAITGASCALIAHRFTRWT